VRIFVVIATLLIGTPAAFAQQQENKLVDRLLRPNMSLANSDQNKKFTNGKTSTFEKAARTHSFQLVRSSATKSWSGERTFTPQQFAARHFRAGDTAANISTRSQLTKNDTVVATPAATAGTRVAPENSEKPAPVGEYAGTRPFLGKGKSQKALDRKNEPLTIEQVRELLNKSK